jgi:hypothetical protein
MPLRLCLRIPLSMPSSRVQQRSAILVFIGSGLSDSEISRARGCPRYLVRKIWSTFKSGDNSFEPTAQLGWPTKLTDELLMALDTLCSREVRSSSAHLAAILVDLMPSRLQAVMDVNGGHILCWWIEAINILVQLSLGRLTPKRDMPIYKNNHLKTFQSAS